MSKYTTMSFNQLRATASAKGFTGKSPNREELVNFLESKEPSVGSISPQKSISISKPAAISVSKPAIIAASASEEEKRKYTIIPRTEVKARRKAILEAAKSLLGDADKPVTQARVFETVCEATGIEKTANSWNDLTLALRSLSDQGFVARNKATGKRATYCKA